MPSVCRTTFRGTAALLLVVLLGACSRAEFAYRNADLLLEFQAWRTARINADQLERWQPLLKDTLQRHREEELPLLVAWLDLAARLAAETDAEPDAARLVDCGLLLARQHAQLAVNLSAPLLADLDTAQIEHLAGYTAKRQRRAEKRYLDPDPQRRAAARQERFVKRIEYWTGRLNEDQRKLVGESVARIPDLSGSWLARRTRQTEELLDMLEKGADEQQLRAHLEDWWVRRAGRSAEDRQQWDTAREKFERLMDELGRTLHAEQRTRLLERLAKLRTELEAFLPAQVLPADLRTVPACAPTS